MRAGQQRPDAAVAATRSALPAGAAATRGRHFRPVTVRSASTIASGSRRAARRPPHRPEPLADRAGHPVGAGEHPAVAGAVAARDHRRGLRGRLVGVSQRLGHVPGHRPGHQQRVRMPRRGDQPRPVPLGVVHRPNAPDLHLAAIARTGIDVADLQRTHAPPQAVPSTGCRRPRRALGDAADPENLADPTHAAATGRPPGRRRADPPAPRPGRGASRSTPCAPTASNSAMCGRRDRIDHRVAVLARHDHTRPSQHPQLLRQIRRLQPHLGQQFAHRPIPHHSNSRILIRAGCPRRLEELPFELVERLRHHDSPDEFDFQRSSPVEENIRQ